MKTRVYYGQYSLKHWINLMLKRNIVLPEYQRSFVWEEKDTKRLIKSFYEGQFVQPITIAQYKAGNTERNLILDGQQRLTSILLYYLGYFPNKDKFNVLEESVITSDDPTDDETTNDKANDKKIIGWTFEDLLKNTTNTIEAIKEKLKDDDKYLEIPKDKDIILDDNFLDNHFLGFSYIIPNCNNCDEINSYYSTLFRKINYYGVSLTNLERRRSLYYMRSDIRDYFDGKIEEKYVLCDIKAPNSNANVDLIRYLSNLSLYYTLKEKNEWKFNTEENFYKDYVFHVLGQETEYYNFEDSLKDNWRDSYKRIREFIEQHLTNFGINEATKSWREIDFWLSGLIYWSLFENKTFKIDSIEQLFKDIKQKINYINDMEEIVSKLPTDIKDELQKQLNEDKQVTIMPKSRNKGKQAITKQNPVEQILNELLRFLVKELENKKKIEYIVKESIEIYSRYVQE